MTKCLMLKGTCVKWSFKRCWDHSIEKIEMSKSKTKMLEREQKRKNGESKQKKSKERDTNRRIKKWSFAWWKMILGLITSKHSLGLFILSFETINLGLHYVPENSILIEHGYLDLRVFFLEKFFIINKAVVFFSSAKILGKLFTCSGWIFWVHNRTIEKKWKKNVTLGWKPKKGSLEQKWENSQRLTGKANRRMKGQRPDNIRSIYEVFTPSKVDKSKPSIQESLP